MLPPGEERDKQIILQLYMMHENKEMKESNKKKMNLLGYTYKNIQ